MTRSLVQENNWRLNGEFSVAYRGDVIFVMQRNRFAGRKNRYNLVVLCNSMRNVILLADECPPGQCRRLAQKFCEDRGHE